jgi:hypothetical protein
MVSSLGHKLVSSASVAGRLGAIAGPVSYQTASCRTSCAFLSLLMQDLSIGLWMLLDLSPFDLSVCYIMPALEWTQTFPRDLRRIFTAGSLVRALGNSVTTEKLLKSDDMIEDPMMVRQLEYLLFRLDTLSFDAFTRIC